MGWIDVAAADELQIGEMKRLHPQGHKLLLCRTASGYYCIDEMCSHEDYSLWFGSLKDDSIKCSLHGSYFDLTSGKPLNEPANCPIRTYPVDLLDGRVRIRLSFGREQEPAER
ncbi:MAG: non-heme iron oxygenase ferredoxin subunit [Quisquiliibacterium sp.]